MMKRLISILLLLTLLTGCGSSPKESTPTTANTEPPIAMVNLVCVTKIFATYDGEEQTATVRYEADGIHILPDTTGSRYETVLDAFGKEIYELHYNDENILTYRTDWTYDEAGNLVEWQFYDVVEDEVVSRITRVYDENGRLIKIDANHRADIPGDYFDFTYDANGHLASRSYTDTEGVNTWNNTYTCDDSGRIVTGTISYPLYDNDEHIQLGYYTLSYDDAGHLTTQNWTQTHRNMFVHYNYEYIYDEAGYLIMSCMLNENHDIVSMENYTYGSNHRLIGITDHLESSTFTFVYEQVELSPLVATSAAVFADTGLINYYVPMPEFQH